MIDVRQAAAKAIEYMTYLIKDASDVTLEEVEPSEDDRFWNITLSALVPAPVEPPNPQLNISPLGSLFKPRTHRVYKILQVNAENGSVRSMKIRQLA
jgi:hypothetical protein